MTGHRGAWVALGAGALVFAAFGCGPSHSSKHPGDDLPPVTISIIRPLPAGEDGLVLPGRIAAGEEVVVTARTAARVTALRHREGDRFGTGEPLVSFDAPEARAALDAARAALEAATLRSDVAGLQEARMESLFAARVASQRERELAQSERRDAEAALAAARAGHAELEASLAISAPFDGVVVRRMLDPGSTVSPGQPLLAIRSVGSGEIVAAVPESDLDRLAGARFAFRPADGAWREARLVRVDGMTDHTTRTRVARFRPATRGEPLEPGAFAHVRIEGGSTAAAHAGSAPGGLSVPAEALVRRGALTGVFVVREGRAHLRWLRLGTGFGDRVEVLSGLSAADTIAADPAGLTDGRAVEVVR